ncbi:MAG: DUF4255 domain-containing protein [Oscillochloris sp.]|nr:DUF4255 domain-containing protein [Oscillochloris sp.]
MSDYRVLQEVGLYLRNLLFEYLRTNDALTTRFTSENNISLDSPANLADVGRPGVASALLSLYLYQVTPNNHVNNTGYLPAVGGQQFFPPISLNLSFLLTPLNSSPEDSLITLGHAMQILAAHSVIRAGFFDSRLQPKTPEVKLAINPVTLEELTRIWNAFNQPYRLSVCYQVQYVAIDSIRQPKAGPPVIERLLDVHQIDPKAKER